MGTGQVSPVLRVIRKIARARVGGEGTDAQLLGRFVARRDEAAFEALVGRHGPMVWGVCRRLLHHPEDAEDAFQATFLVLVRKAPSLRQPQLLGSWLYGVACRTAARAKVEAAKRRAQETRAAERPTLERADPAPGLDLRPVLDDEIQGLPDKYRAAFVLCYLQGRTNKEAAKQLGCAEGTIFSRLAWARQRLRTRLARRGLAPGVAGLAAVLAPRTAPAAAASPLFASTVRAAMLFGTGQAAPAGWVSPHAASLAQGVLKAMKTAKVKTALLTLLAVCLLGIGTAASLCQAPAAGQGNPGKVGRSASAPPRAAKAQRRGDDESRRDRQRLQGTWVPLAVPKAVGRSADLAKDKLVFQGDRVTVNPGKDQQVWSFRLDSRQQPKAVTLTVVDGPARGKTFAGIYSLDGNYLEVCFNDRQAGKRPQAFVTTADGGGNRLFVLQREDAGEEAASRQQSRLNLKTIALALHDYRREHGRFPPAAVYGANKPLYSWRVALLPYLEQKALYRTLQPAAAWDDPANRFLAATAVGNYYPAVKVKAGDSAKTFYQVFVGKGTVFGRKEGTRLQDIKGGLSNTILVVEAGTMVPWAQPADLPYEAGKPLPRLDGMFPEGFHVLLADGSVRSIKKKFNEKVMRLAITGGDGQKVNWDDLSR
jgi:RNA polymerase sigma factor (sigma-70 family)